MKATILDGKIISKGLREQLKQNIMNQKKVLSLATIITKDDESIKAYVRNKDRICSEVGITSKNYFIDRDSSFDDLMELIGKLNNDPEITGILVQLPLREGFDEKTVASAISPQKDVDGITPANMGKLYAGEKCVIPCTAKGILKLIKHTGFDICGKHAVVVGRSNIVGKPSAAILLRENATVTICHSKTRDLKEVLKSADIVVSAVGKPNLIRGEMIKDGAVVIDAGTTMVEGKLTGDVAFPEACEIASWITPVPGGVGSMTTTMLIENLLEASSDKCL